MDIHFAWEDIIDYKNPRTPSAAKRPTATRHLSLSEYPSGADPKEDDFSDNASQWSETESTLSTGRSSTADSHSTRTSVSFGDVDYYFGEENQIEFPSYDDADAAHRGRVLDLCATVSALPLLSPPRDSSPSVSDVAGRAEDDVAIAEEPSRHVDYLSHDWSEEDIWTSWKHLRSKRRVYSKRERLENAAWRLWEKVRQNLGTVAPESINWMKDRDTTWLYGPFQSMARGPEVVSVAGDHVETVSPKLEPAVRPILKKRTLSEALLQRDSSTTSLVLQGATIDIRDTSVTQPISNDLTKKSVRFAPPTTQEVSTPTKTVRFHLDVEQCTVAGTQDYRDEVEHEDELDYCLNFQSTSPKSDVDTSIWKSTYTASKATLENSEAGINLPAFSADPLSTTEATIPATCTALNNSNSYLFDVYQGNFHTTNSSAIKAMYKGHDEDDYIEWFSPVDNHDGFDKPKIEHNILPNLVEGEQAANAELSDQKTLTACLETEKRSNSPLYNSPDRQIAITAIESDLESDVHSTSDTNSVLSERSSTDDAAYNSLPGLGAAALSEQNSISLLLDPVRRGLVDRVMEGFWSIFDQEWDPKMIRCAADTSGSSKGAGSSTSNALRDSPHTQRKRQRGNDDDDLEDNRERTPRLPRRSPASKDEDEATRFACPFRKHNPRQYNIYNNRVCALSHWSSIARVKEHLYRCHQVSPHCKRCWRTFKSQQLLDSHLTVAATDICEVQEGKAPAGITVAMERQLRSRKKSHPGQTDEERWKEIYKLLFPNAVVPSPYFEAVQVDRSASPDSRDLADYEDYIRRELPRLVRSNIEEAVRRETQPLEAALIGSLVGIIQDCQDRVFRAYRESQGIEQEVPTPTPENTTFSISSQTNERDASGLPLQSSFLDAAFESPMRTEYFVPELVGFGRPTPVPLSDSGYSSEPRCKCAGPCACLASSPELRFPPPTTGPVRDLSTPGVEGAVYPDWHHVDATEDEADWWMNI